MPERETKREKEKDLSWVSLLPKCLQQRKWSRLKPRARNNIVVPPMGGKRLWAITYRIPGPIAKTWTRRIFKTWSQALWCAGLPAAAQERVFEMQFQDQAAKWVWAMMKLPIVTHSTQAKNCKARPENRVYARHSSISIWPLKKPAKSSEPYHDGPIQSPFKGPDYKHQIWSKFLLPWFL